MGTFILAFAASYLLGVCTTLYIVKKYNKKIMWGKITGGILGFIAGLLS